MQKGKIHISNIGRWLYLVGVVCLCGCNATKFVPQGQYLLNDAKVKVADATPGEDFSDLSKYLRQQQNTEILGFWKLQMHVWNTAPRDTTTQSKKRLAANAHKMGEEPVIYDPDLTVASMNQLQRVMANRGYFQAQVDTSAVVKKRKINLTYTITANQPYKIRDYRVTIEHPIIDSIASSSTLVHKGDIFNTEVLDAERDRITKVLHDEGYYYFDKSLLVYKADSNFNAHEVAVELRMSEDLQYLPDSILNRIFQRYTIRRVAFHLDYDPSQLPEGKVLTRTTQDQYEYSFVDKPLLRNRILRKYCAVRPGDYYCAANVEKSYSQLNGLQPVKYVDISFAPDGDSQLICHVTVSRTKLNSVNVDLDGTYSAGDWGVATGVGYVNKNIFRGAEQLSLNARFSYEWRQNGGRALEAKAEAGLLFPNSLQIKFAYQYQHRPDEFTRNIASAGLYYTARRSRPNWKHSFNLFDLNYVYLPWISSDFRAAYIDKPTVLKYSFEDHFIMDWSYTGQYSTQRQGQINRDYVNFTYTVETAGNALYLISKAAKLPKNENDNYTLLNIPFAQYAKADVNFTYHQVLVPDHRLVYHIGVGVVVPYLNASVVPFEKRYFSGGSNSVRGWQSRTLGPGAFKGAGGGFIYDLQTGDIRLDLNLEYRYHVWNFIELAAFTDAGNIWTIREYEKQEFGVFEWGEFYKQLAWSYGAGLRFNLNIIVLRLDFGVKLHDPTRLHTDGKVWRTIGNDLSWKDDMTLHFAIGYPF